MDWILKIHTHFAWKCVSTVKKRLDRYKHESKMRKKHSNSIRKSEKRHGRFKTGLRLLNLPWYRRALLGALASSPGHAAVWWECSASLCAWQLHVKALWSPTEFCRRRFTVRVCPAGRRSAHQRWQLYQYGELDDVTSTYFVLTRALRYPAVLSVLSYFFFLM